MSVTINISLSRLSQLCDWRITEGHENLNIKAIIDVNDHTIMYSDGVLFLKEYEPQDYGSYIEQLEDFDTCEFLPCNCINGRNSVVYNDDIEETSENVFPSSISEIIGGVKTIELKVFSSFQEMDNELTIMGSSFTDEPKYKLVTSR